MGKRTKFEVVSNYLLTFLTLVFIFMLLIYELNVMESYTETLEGFEGSYALGFVLVYIIMYIPMAITLLVMFILMLCFTGKLLGRAKMQKILSQGGELPQGKKYKAPSLVGLIVVKIIAVLVMAFATYMCAFAAHASVVSYIFYPVVTLLMLASVVVSCINHKKVK